MKQSTNKGGRAWFLVGVALLSFVALWWLLVVLIVAGEPENAFKLIGISLFLSAVLIGIGIYCVRRGRRGTLKEELRGLKESVRDKTRDKLCADLCAMGLDAHMLERGRPEEGVVGGSKGGSLGLIEIRAGPIRWVSVLRHTQRSGGGLSGGSETVTYTNVYLVSDTGIGRERRVEVKSIPVKSVLLFGRVIDLLWKGKLQGDLIRRLNEDLLLKQSLLRVKEDVTIRSFPDVGCWAISSRWYQADWLGRTPKKLTPSREQWSCYETIARHLLESSGK